jgi:hypothetical protein
MGRLMPAQTGRGYASLLKPLKMTARSQKIFSFSRSLVKVITRGDNQE